MGAEGADFLASHHIPKDQGLVLAGEGELPAVRTKNHPRDVAAVTWQAVEQLSGGCVPKSDNPIRICRGQAAPVATVIDAANTRGCLQGAKFLAGEYVP